VRRDLSLENVLLSSDGTKAVICDLGMALRLPGPYPDGRPALIKPQPRRGKAAYMAIEVRKGTSPSAG
jgi:serine/threonine protein kinase